MIKLGVELYAALCAFSTIAFLALALASKRKGIFDDLESIKEFDQLVGNREYAFEFPDRQCDRRCWWACHIISRINLTLPETRSKTRADFFCASGRPETADTVAAAQRRGGNA